MDFIKFINSNDIREHLKSINYKPSPLECAWLVDQSLYATLDDRILSFEYIINNMPDAEIISATEDMFNGSLHEFLKEYIKMKRDYLSGFNEDSEDVFIYTYEIETLSDEIKSEIYYSFEECKKAIYGCYSPEELIDIRINKVKISDKSGSKYWVDLSPKGDIVDVFGPLTDFRWKLICTFRNIKVDIPTPFKSGDILYDTQNRQNYIGLNPFVFKEIENEKATVICIDKITSMLFEDKLYNYMNFEYYREEINGCNKLLKYISEYFKSEHIDMLSCLNGYLITYIDSELNRITAEHSLVKKELKM